VTDVPATFQRRDGVALPIVPGFRNRILSYRESVTPKDTWTTQEYEAAAEKKRARFTRLIGEAAQWLPSLNDVAVLDVGCGDGTNTLLFGLEPVREAVGIDLRLPLFSPDMHGSGPAGSSPRCCEAGGAATARKVGSRRPVPTG
jgi:hypothetical protein